MIKLKLKLSKLCCLVMLIVVILSLSFITVSAHTPTFTYYLIRGIEHLECYLDNSAKADFQQNIYDAGYNWINPGWSNTIDFITEKVTNWETDLDFFGVPTSFWGDSNILGECYTNDEDRMRVNPNIYMYYYATIYLNVDELPQRSDVTTTIIHEMGHAFGLAHYISNTNSVMYPYNSSRNATVVAECDNDALVDIY